MNDWSSNLFNDYQSEYELILGDARENLLNFESDKYDLIITSPPDHIGKECETKQSIEKYLEQQHEIIDQLIRVISKKGSICW